MQDERWKSLGLDVHLLEGRLQDDTSKHDQTETGRIPLQAQATCGAIHIALAHNGGVAQLAVAQES